MKIAYFGLPLGALLLEADGHNLVTVALSREDTPGLYRAKKHFENRLRIRPDVKKKETIQWVAQTKPDLLVSWFWTTKLPTSLTSLCPLGAIGCHPSLLPRHRGPDPYYWAIARGDTHTGVTVHRIAEEYDTGAIIEQRTLAIDPSWTAWKLARALDRPSLAALRHVVMRLSRGEKLVETEQDESLATEAPQPDEAECELDFRASTDSLVRKIRALSPAPGAWFQFDNDAVVVLKAQRATSFVRALTPGEAMFTEGGMIVRTSDGALLIERAELDGQELEGKALKQTLLRSGQQGG